MAAPRQKQNSAKTRLDAKQSKKNVALNKVEQKQKLNDRKTAMSRLDRIYKDVDKAKKNAEKETTEAEVNIARIGILEKEIEARQVELTKRLKAKDEHEKNLARLGRFAVQKATETYTEVRVDGLPPDKPPSPPTGAPIFWLVAFYIALGANILKRKAEIKRLK